MTEQKTARDLFRETASPRSKRERRAARSQGITTLAKQISERATAKATQ